jgi:glycosyltransferase involved in cell wall biosynthesis
MPSAENSAPLHPPTAQPPSLSVVIPCHNEAENVRPLYGEIRAALEPLDESFEILFVDDGSTDATAARLAEISNADERVVVLELDGNFGEAAALSAGFHHARGELVVTLDGDGQNDPADIPGLLDLLRQRELQAVSGRRSERKEGYWLRVLPSRIANELIARVTGVPVRDCGCGLKVYRRSALPKIHLPRGMNRFLPALFGITAQQVAEVEVHDRRREHGASHYGIGRTIVVLRDLLALPFLVSDPKQAEITFALLTAGAAGVGALALQWSPAATFVLDAAAVAAALVWWNVRRFNRAQTAGVYELRRPEAN